MIIVLGIAALTMLIGWPSMQRTIQKNEERQFWQTFRQAWQAAQVRSKTSNESTHVFLPKEPQSGCLFLGKRHRAYKCAKYVVGQTVQ